MTNDKKPEALLLNDIHVSKDNIPEFQANWDEALNLCRERGIRFMIVGGDLWQSRASQTLSTLLAVREALLKATDVDTYGIDVALAEGNHDKVDQESLLGYSHLFSEYSGVFMVDDYEVFALGNTAMVYVMSYFPENGSFTERLQAMIKQRFDPAKRNILYIHEGINGALATPGDKELPAHLFSDFDAVLVGHYHDRCWINGTNIEYIGASRQHNFGEDEEKGYTILYDDGSYEFVKNRVNRRYKTIDVPLSEVDDTLVEELRQTRDEGVYRVRMRVECAGADVANVDKQLLLEAGAAKVEIINTDSETAERVQAHSLDKKFDKRGIKQAYIGFCAEKEVDDVKSGLYYLDKIAS